MSSISINQQPEQAVAAVKQSDKQGQFVVTFRGVRGSYAVPGKDTMGVGGNTPCIEVRAGNHVLIFDAGTGIIELGRELAAEHFSGSEEDVSPHPVVATIFFSHMHHDHTQGFPFFSPAYIRGSRIYVFGPRLARQDLEQTLTQALLTPFFPVDLDEMAAHITIRNFGEDEAVIFSPDSDEPQKINTLRAPLDVSPDCVVVRTFRGYSHPGGIHFYRVEYRSKCVVYATDTEGYVGGDVNLAKFAAGADLLIHDAQYKEVEYVGSPVPTQGYGHSTPAMAAAVAAAAGVGRLALFHHDPRHDDETVIAMGNEAQRLFAPCITAQEGMAIDLL